MREYSPEIEETFLYLGTSFWGYSMWAKFPRNSCYFARVGKQKLGGELISICAKKYYTTLYGNKTSAFLKARILQQKPQKLTVKSSRPLLSPLSGRRPRQIECGHGIKRAVYFPLV